MKIEKYYTPPYGHPDPLLLPRLTGESNLKGVGSAMRPTAGIDVQCKRHNAKVSCAKGEVFADSPPLEGRGARRAGRGQ